MLEVEAVAEDHFGDEVIGRTGDTYADAEVDFPFGRKIEIDGGKKLVLLLGDRIEIGGGAYGAVVFEAGGDFFGEVVTDFDVGGKDEALIFGEAVEGLVKGGVEREIPAIDLFVDDGAHLPGPSVDRVFAARVADFVGEAEADGPFPFGRDADAGANVVADPVEALAILRRSENVETGFEPVGEAVSDFDGFVELVVGGESAVGGGLGTLESEIGVEFDHGVAGLDGFVGIDLDFVVFLGGRGRRNNTEGAEYAEGTEKSGKGNNKPPRKNLQINAERARDKMEVQAKHGRLGAAQTHRLRRI